MGSSKSKSKLSSEERRNRTKAAASVTDADRAVLRLKTQRRKLEGTARRLQALADAEAQRAREKSRAGERQAALLALRKRRVDLAALERVMAWQANVESTLAEIESARQSAAVFAALRAGADTLTAMQRECSVEDVERLVEDQERAGEWTAEVEGLLSGVAGPASEVEAAAESELAALEAEMLEEELPAVPSEELPARTEETAVAAAQEAEAREEPEPEPEPEPERVAVLA